MNENLTLNIKNLLQKLQIKSPLWKYRHCYSTSGRHIQRICRTEPNLHISPSTISGGFYKFCRWSHHLFHCCSHHSMICPNYWIAAMYLPPIPPEVVLHWQPYLMVSSSLILFPFPQIFLALFCCDKFMSLSFIETYVPSWKMIIGSFLKICQWFNG